MGCLDRDCGQMNTAATLGVASIRLSKQPLLAGIKHLNRLEQVLAAAQAQAEGTDECIVLDQTDHLTCVVAGNLFLVRSGELLTPKLLDCGVLGTRRRLIIEKWAPSIGLQVREVRLKLSDLLTAEEVFYSNSLQTVRPVIRLGEQSWDNHSVCTALFQRYLEEFVMIQRFLVVLLAMAILGAFAVGELRNRWAAPLMIPEQGFILTVAQGDSLQTVVDSLHTAGVLTYPRLVILYGRWTGLDQQIKPGEYLLPINSTAESMLMQLQSGDVIKYQVTLPEGITLAMALDILKQQKKLEKTLAGPTDPRLLEMIKPHSSSGGTFFPGHLSLCTW